MCAYRQDKLTNASRVDLERPAFLQIFDRCWQAWLASSIRSATRSKGTLTTLSWRHFILFINATEMLECNTHLTREDALARMVLFDGRLGIFGQRHRQHPTSIAACKDLTKDCISQPRISGSLHCIAQVRPNGMSCQACKLEFQAGLQQISRPSTAHGRLHAT